MSQQLAKSLILAALPREIASLTRGWKRQAGSLKLNHGHDLHQAINYFESPSAIAAAVGMGARRAGLMIAIAAETGRVRNVATVGFAGALQAGIEPGMLLRPSQVIDARTGERYSLEDGDGTVAVSTSAIAGAEEKQRMALSYAAQSVDMEAAAVARLCAARGLPCLAFKAISDNASFSLPSLNQFATADGQFRTVAFSFHIASRPRLWRSAMELGAGAAKAEGALTGALQAWLASQG